MATNFNYRNDAPQYLIDFLTHIEIVKNRSQLTVKNYYCDLRLFLRFLKKKNDPSLSSVELSQISIADIPDSLVKNVTLMDILEFLTYSKQSRDNQPKARARKAVALRQFFKYLTDNKGWFEVSPAAKLELPSPKNALPKHLTIEQANQLLAECSEIKTWADSRDYCMITFFLNCGMRLSELVGISVNDYIKSVDPKTGNAYSFLKVIGKGNKERIIYLNNACVSAYEAYLKVRPNVQNEKALFLSKQYKRISNRRVEQIIEEKLMKSGLSGYGFSVHKLRHTAATLMYQNGVDVRVLKEVLGHENLNTTQIYTHVSDNQIKQAMDQNPLSEIAAPDKNNGD
ncbi:MAG: tyrosine recombinase XerC [Firmicutes bacterium]|nr:tyrosine recombinase XerC [[Eubacterium] siraeum]MCM1488789.1 tyrosine recombinase XerC [Bacillota bacterium]